MPSNEIVPRQHFTKIWILSTPTRQQLIISNSKQNQNSKHNPPPHVQTKPPQLHPHPTTHATTKANGITSGAKKKKKTPEPPHHYEGKNSRKWNLAEKSKHRHSNESNLQTKIKTHLISSAPLKEVTNPKIYRNTNINNRAKTHKLVSKTRQNPNEKIHKLKQKW